MWDVGARQINPSGLVLLSEWDKCLRTLQHAGACQLGHCTSASVTSSAAIGSDVVDTALTTAPLPCWSVAACSSLATDEREVA